MTDQFVEISPPPKNSGRFGAKQWLLAAGILIAAALLIVVAVAWINLLSRPANELGLRGGFKVDVEPGIRVFVGDQHVGSGPVDVSWDDVLGAGEFQPLAIPIAPNSPSPHIESAGGVTAEPLAAEGSQIVWKEDSMSGTNQMVEPIVFAFKDVLIRRTDGSLDHMYVLDAAFPRAGGRWQRLLVPIRLRSEQTGEAYFADPRSMGTGASQGFVTPGGSIGDNQWFSVKFRRGTPPDEFAAEIERDGLWEPSQ